MMSRLSQLKNHVQSLSLLTAVALLWAVPQTAASAAGYVYQQHTVNAGVIFAGSAGTPVATVGDPAPYLFYVLNNRPDARPIDLTLINPQAPSTVTQAMAKRWGYTLGNAVTPNMAGYWEVPLHDLSSEELQQYTVLYLNASNVDFSAADNEKLRRFVDSGGQLFVEYTGAGSTLGLFTGTDYATGGGTLSLPPDGTSYVRHPLLSQPYLLSATEVTSLGTPTGAIAAAAAGKYLGEEYNLFGPVVVNGNPSGVVAAQYGAGQVVVSGINIGGAISSGNGAFYAPPIPPAVVPASDLKFLSNLISWSETHPNEFKTSHGNASATGLSAFSTSWLYTPPTPWSTPPPAATVWGNFVFVTQTNTPPTTGTIHAFDAYPSENLWGGAADDGLADFSAVPPTTYDEIWNNNNTIGANASAPTIASYKGTTIAFVEKADGSIVSFDAITGGTSNLTFPMPANATNFANASYPLVVTNAPSPTYSDGRLYAGQANGTLTIYDLNEATAGNVPGVNIPLNPTSSSGETVVGPPSVGILPNNDTNIIIALVPTTQNIYTVLLGARNEPLIQYNPGNVLTGYSIDRQRRYGVPNLVADTNALVVPLPKLYYSNGALGPNVNAVTPVSPNPQDPLFPLTDYGSFFTDWDTDFTQTVQSNASTFANLNFISANTLIGINQSGQTPLTGTFSTPAIDRRGDYYYTLTAGTAGINSYLVGVKNALLPSNVQLKFRFRIPTAADAASWPTATDVNGTYPSYMDADKVDYTALIGYHFVGPPVVDDLGNVYAAATNGSKATVLCFKGNQGATATISGIDLSTANLQQIDENSSPPQPNSLSVSNGTTTSGQYTVSTNQATGISQATFYNFGRTAISPQIAGNLSEPQPVQATSNGTATFTPDPYPIPLHTNLSWYVTPFACGTVTGLSKVGNSLLLTDGTSLYSLPAAPSVGGGKVASGGPSKTSLGLGTVGAPPSVGGSVMVVNGENGIGALTRQVTVVADNHRVLGVDSSGTAIWAVDATTNGTSKVPFSHPVSLSQFADNQFLVADTGNNRCVRFDPGGNVQWELTRFSDPNGLMAPGQPDTLSQPTSVQPHIVPTASGTTNYYLIADSGNDRIVEVADVFNAAGVQTANHVLTWVTHTADQSGRRYRYGSATYYANTASPSGLSIAATVTNTRIGPLIGTAQPYALSPASSDAPGGCLVVFNYPVTVTTFANSPANDLVYVAPGFYDSANTAYTVKNPRFLELYRPTTPPPAGTPPYSFLYADDNGAFDLSYVTNSFVAKAGSLQFTAANYQSMNTSIIGDTGATYSRANLPFVPTCVQRIDTNPTNLRYLITQSFSQGELGAVTTPRKIGGEVFEIDGSNTPVGGFGNGSTLSHPPLTGPLTQPTFAVRLP